MKLRSQPRIPGVKRERANSALPPVVNEGIKAIALSERKSRSWVEAEVICDWFGVNAETGKLKPGDRARALARQRLGKRRLGQVDLPDEREKKAAS